MFLLLGPGAAAAAMALDPALDRIPLWSTLQTVADPQGSHGIEQVAAMVASGRAGHLPHANHAFGKGCHTPTGRRPR